MALQEGHAASVEDCSLTVFGKVPILGASPDGIVRFTCECCNYTVRLLEVKCPQQMKNSFRGVEMRVPKLSYETQINVIMGILYIQKLDFFVYRSQEEAVTVTI